jgi:diadenosine tetraphosphate (Ap4A) HIT family hydrolase
MPDAYGFLGMTWDQLAAGVDCPFDSPRKERNEFWDTVAPLAVSTLCLLKNQAYRGHCILIYDVRHAVRPDQLTADEWSAFSADLHSAATAVTKVCHPDHINVESLGMQVPHLHWQVVPRYRNDPRWGGPIWTTTIEEFEQARVELPASERAELIAALRKSLGKL